MRKNVVARKFEPEYYLARFRPAVFEYTGQASKEWTVTLTGWYFIEARGAKAADGQWKRGGCGAIVRGRFMLHAGDTLHVLVGGTSERARGCSGGAGGTFVTLNGRNVPLVVAGGGGGTRGGLKDADGQPGSLMEQGGDGVGAYGAPGGAEGQPGSNAQNRHGNGGGGFALTDPDSPLPNRHFPGPGNSFTLGGACVYGNSGFGGGGGHGSAGGGGAGGYSGGGGGAGGGGGGSYIRRAALDVSKSVAGETDYLPPGMPSWAARRQGSNSSSSVAYGHGRCTVRAPPGDQSSLRHRAFLAHSSAGKYSVHDICFRLVAAVGMLLGPLR